MSTPTAMKKLAMVTAGAVLITLHIGGAAQAVVLTFDDNTSDIGSIPDSYGGLDWSNFSYTDSSWTPAYQGSGYINGTVSGNYVAFNRYGESATLTSSSGFDFSSAYLSAAWNNGLSITVEGLNDGTSLYSTTVVADTMGSTLFDFDYQGIDELRFTSFGGDNPGFEDDRGRDGQQFVLDNFAFNPLPTAPDPGEGGTDPVVVTPDPGEGGTDPGEGGTEPEGGTDPGEGGTEPEGGTDPGEGGTEPEGGTDPGEGGTEPVVVTPDPGEGGTEPIVVIPDPGEGGTEPIVVTPDPGEGGTEPIVVTPDPGEGGTEPIVVIPGMGDGVTVPGEGGAPDPGTPTPIPYEPSSGLGLLTLGAFGAGAVLKRKLQQKTKAKNFI